MIRNRRLRHHAGRGVAWRLGTVVALLAALGCARTDVPVDRFYRLQLDLAADSYAEPLLSGTLVVERFVADSLVGGRPLVYSTTEAPNQLNQFHYHYWADPPIRMLQELAVPHLRAAKVATQVVTPESRADADYVLTAKLRRFEQVRGESTFVDVSLEFALDRVSDGRVIWIKTYDVRAACRDQSVAAAIDAFGGAVGEVYTRMVQDLRAVRGS